MLQSSTTTTTREKSNQLYLYLVEIAHDQHPKDTHALRDYNLVADRLRENPDSRKFVDDLYEGFMDGNRMGVFNALCLPSGTGKTQLAFSLPPDCSACVYLNMSADPQQQPVYKAFSQYMVYVVTWLRDACDHPTHHRFLMFGFFRALFRLLRNHPQSRLKRK
jgi:hypothetical protein